MLPNARKTGRLYYSDALDQNQLPRLVVHSTWIDDRWLILDIIPSVALLSGHSSAYYAVGAIAMNLSISASAKVCCLLKLNRAACVDQPECGASESSRILPWKSHLGVTQTRALTGSKKSALLFLAPKIKRPSITFLFSPTDFL